MKRCPQCEFTFEDHENYCDFDGAELSPIFERPLSSKSYSIPNDVLIPQVRRLLRSNFSLAVLGLSVIVFNALVVAYYSASEVEPRDNTVAVIPALVANEWVKSQVGSVPTSTPISVATAHPKKAKVLTGRRSRTSRQSASMQFARASGQSAVFRSKKSSSSYVRAPKVGRSYSQPQLEARAAVHPSSQLFQARNPKRAEVPEQVAQPRSSVVDGAVKSTGGHSGWTEKESLVEFPQKKQSKFIAALKKTGRVLSWPFRF